MLCLTLLAAPLELRAEDRRAEAEGYFRRGYERYSRQEYDGALAMFLKARRIYPSFKIDLNIGYTLDALGRRAEAAGTFQRFLARASGEVDVKVARRVRQRLQALNLVLARVEITCDVRGAEVSVDGQRVGLTPLQHKVYLKPGPHGVQVSKAGRVLFRRTVDLGRGEQLLLSVARAPVALTPVAVRPTAAPRARPFYQKWWFWTAVGVVVAGAVVGGVVGSQAGGSGWVPGGDSGSIRLPALHGAAR